MEKRDYYEVLEIDRNASGQDIKAAYRKMAMKYHPDRNPDNKDAEEKFKEAAEAYEVLNDPQKKSRYDQFGHDGLHGMGGGHSGFSNIEDIFSAFSDVFSGGGNSIFDEFFGGGSRRRSSRRSMAQRGSDLRVRIPLTLEEIAKGVEKTLKVKKSVVCDDCNGTGAATRDAYQKCNVCDGTGEIRHVSRSMFGQFVNIAECSNCAGTGQIITDVCKTCHGNGRVQSEEKVTVTIPAGVEGGNYIPLRGKGNAGYRGGDPGDLIVVIDEKEHDLFERSGNDIIYKLRISYPDAALGKEIEVPTLFGDEEIKIEAGTQPGTVITLRDKGIPYLRSYKKGDQKILINVYVPKKLSSKEKQILKDLADSENICPLRKEQKKEKDFFEKVKDVFF
jgi:molecular chaperone DnaJ